ncbi:hypothetical protein K4A83_15165 [Spirulina subsalsa FACHB-351]|uniref:Uncharacterized protein n=1 Tax=Spirulina subsalsa FACHB-351 TaxID=234711 RepID=A0ABT3L7X5_9CYAN|nr:hypothetical protein [Spirulina subsalsa]MCW6037605.1 hypothetical protein [Spirulina subsalsa FACHB-351]
MIQSKFVKLLLALGLAFAVAACGTEPETTPEGTEAPGETTEETMPEGTEAPEVEGTEAPEVEGTEAPEVEGTEAPEEAGE